MSAAVQKILSDAELPYPRVCAHRGFNTVAPENSLAAFGAAIALGAPEIELDIRFSKDGVPVVAHDSRLDRVSNGSGVIEEKSYDELLQLDFGVRFSEEFTGLKILRFDEVLEKFAQQVIINLHLKTAEQEGAPEYPQEKMELILSQICKYGQEKHIYFMGDPAVMTSALKYATHIPRCMGAFPGPWEIVDRAIAFKCAKVQLFAPYFNQEMIDKAHQHGIICNFFHCEDPAEAVKLVNSGVDVILANDYWRVAQAVAGIGKK